MLARAWARVRAATRGVLALAAVLLVLSCHTSEEAGVDGETHFLRACTPAANACGAALTCSCGVCVMPCNGDAECSALSESAQCIASAHRSPAACAEPGLETSCDVPCNADDECKALASDFACLGGFCRPTSAREDAGVSNGICQRGQVRGDEVVVLGDVFIAQDRQITAELEALARRTGALSSAGAYRDFSSPTSNTFTVGGALLLDRYTAARAAGDVKVVITDGGGTDLLLRPCGPPPTPECQLMLDVVDGAQRFLTQLQRDGVEDVVFFFYPDPMDAELRAELHVLRPLLRDLCARSAVSCHWVDLQETFEGRFVDYMRSDYVPTASGAAAAAAAIWSKMETNCVAQ